MKTATEFLNYLNKTYLRLHKSYEDLFWLSYMGDHTVDNKKEKALNQLDNFCSNQKLRHQAEILQRESKNKKLQERLQTWINFFDQYQMPDEAKSIKIEIDTLETKIRQQRTIRKEGYVDPTSGKFVEASVTKMRTMTQTNPDEGVRKACFEAGEKFALDNIDDYVELVKLRNKFAQLLGFTDFYDYKLRKIDRMTKEELFTLFTDITDKTKDIFSKIRDLEKENPKLRQPWNFFYCMTGDFTKEEDKYFQFDQALIRWGRSFSALGIDFAGGTLQLDLLDRYGKWNNGFCHWPKLVNYNKGAREAGSANFTCNVVVGQVGAGASGYNTLFHEGGHAAHFLNITQKDVCLNHEYAPMTSAWSETHSMFIDTLFSSIEWKTRYALDKEGNAYPLELFKAKEEKLNLLKPMRILSIIFVATFEREVYELEKPTAEKIIELAKVNYKKFYDLSEDSVRALSIPHIYSWESSCSYHGYGLAEIALSQWREYFYKKYGYIVDNPTVGKEMKKTWQWGSGKDFQECVMLATGKKLSSQALIKEITMTPAQVFKRAKLRLKTMEMVKGYTKPVNLKARIKMVHGKKTIADNRMTFEVMAEKYAKWMSNISG